MRTQKDWSPPDWSQVRIQLLLIRHGQTPANAKHLLQGQSNGELTEEGAAEVHSMGAYLQGVVVDQIISSDLHRTQQTAAILQHYLNTPLETTPLIREWHVGTLDGKPAQALFDAVAESGLVLEEFQPEGGERLVDVSMRAAQFLASLEDRSRCSLVVCSHGDFLRMLLGKMLNQTIEAANRQQFANASLTVVEQDYTGSWALKLLNFSV